MDRKNFNEKRYEIMGFRLDDDNKKWLKSLREKDKTWNNVFTKLRKRDAKKTIPR